MANVTPKAAPAATPAPAATAGPATLATAHKAGTPATLYTVTRKGQAYRPGANANQWGIMLPLLTAGPVTHGQLVAALLAGGAYGQPGGAISHINWHIGQGRLAPVA